MIDGYDQAKMNALIASDLFRLLWCSKQWNFHRDLSRLKKVADKSPVQCLFSLMETQKLNGREMLFSKCHDFTESKTFSQKSRAQVPE